ncbi:carotenoid oxygenase family protein [Ideonella azotifigens]|uniref:Carotenoid oxygenase family protein n=2 Tax=Ideonella azotifigens TaxID=513160 RepID=A0ABN1KHD9_9BURK|nr:carotenoid oxygenase family protein [Ideonella azotifigens]MCD2340312.1 carotenoid oxygenase family protein [Ideonella azotifigens]
MPQVQTRFREIESMAPFRRSPDVHRPHEAAVTGKVPEWLQGDLLRTCPAVFAQGDWQARHWFDGLGQVYAFRIGSGAVSFQSRLLDSEAAREVAAGRAQRSSFGTPTGRTPWQRLLQPVQRSTDNTNVNIVQMGDELVAMTEGAQQLRIDAATLRSLGVRPYGQDGLDGNLMSAHPHRDFARRQVVNLATNFGSSGGVVSLYEHGDGEHTRRVVGSWRTERVPYLHSFGLTPSRAVLLAHPFSVKPLAMLWSNRGYIDHFEWRPQDGTRLVVMDRATGATTEYETDAMFVFHTVNAFERGSETVLDVLAYPDAAIMEDLRVARMVERLPDLRPSLVRITMRPGQPRAELQTLSEAGFEFPCIHYHRHSGSDYRFAWGAADGPATNDGSGGYASSIVKVDLHSGMGRSFSDGERIYGEPVFVARPGGTDEDDGVLLSVGCSQQQRSSALAILDARTMALLASVEVPAAIPLGFHGSFVHAQGANT